jgi:hypothetical protein
VTHRTIQPVDGIPLRLRRRRDGSVALTDERGAVDAETYQVPSPHLFLYSWLMGAGSTVADVRVGAIILNLANARLVYETVTADEGHREAFARQINGHDDETAARMVAAFTNQGHVARLVSAEAFDAPPVDEAIAAERQAERERREAAEALAAAQALIAQEG